MNLYFHTLPFNLDISATETTSQTALDLKIYFFSTNSMINQAANDSIQWGFANLCINQTYIITNEPTPSPTDPPTMAVSECNYYKTRLSDWDLLYNVTLTEFYVPGIDYVKFTPNPSANYESDWLFSVDTNLYFPENSTDPIWLNIEMNGFNSMNRDFPDQVDEIRPILFSIPLILNPRYHFVYHNIVF